MKPKISKPSTKKKILTVKQNAMLAKHASKHTKVHIANMKKLMKNGDSFTISHKKTMSSKGK